MLITVHLYFNKCRIVNKTDLFRWLIRSAFQLFIAFMITKVSKIYTITLIFFIHFWVWFLVCYTNIENKKRVWYLETVKKCLNADISAAYIKKASEHFINDENKKTWRVYIKHHIHNNIQEWMWIFLNLKKVRSHNI